MKRNPWDVPHKCHICKVGMKKKLFKIDGFKIRGWECPKCKEGVLIGEDAQVMLVFNQIKKGISAKVGTLGNSVFVRFPKEVADLFKIQNGKRVIFKADSLDELKLQIVN